MATKKELLEKLAELDVAVDPNLPKNELENILAEKEAENAEAKPERPKDMAEQGKNFAEPVKPKAKVGAIDPRIGQRDITTNGPDQEIKVITDKDELLKLQEAGRLVHYDPETGKAAIRKSPKLNPEGKPVYEGQILVDRRI